MRFELAHAGFERIHTIFGSVEIHVIEQTEGEKQIRRGEERFLAALEMTCKREARGSG
jgi:hypothetical protein